MSWQEKAAKGTAIVAVFGSSFLSVDCGSSKTIDSNNKNNIPAAEPAPNQIKPPENEMTVEKYRDFFDNMITDAYNLKHKGDISDYSQNGVLFKPDDITTITIVTGMRSGNFYHLPGETVDTSVNRAFRTVVISKKLNSDSPEHVTKIELIDGLAPHKVTDGGTNVRRTTENPIIVGLSPKILTQEANKIEGFLKQAEKNDQPPTLDRSKLILNF